MSGFEKTYNMLNDKQREAVDHIEGPILVLAGPGTGKTQLLSTRVANILQKTDANPNNILCLTYTEAGATAMKERLAKVVGPSGYQVSVHTFHSFALEVMRRFPEYFLRTRGFNAVDDLTSYQILEGILKELPPSFRLTHRSFARENRVSELVSKISELKKSGLSPKQAEDLATQNQTELNSLAQLLELIPSEIPRSKQDGLKLTEDLVEYLQNQTPPAEDNLSIKNLKRIILQELTSAVTEALETNKTKPITEFKNAFLEKDHKNKWRFKDERYNQNLAEVAKIYSNYETQLENLEKLEFDDMILNFIQALTQNDDLKFNVQEQWQYILVDEFQDTSFAQLEIVKLLSQNKAQQEANIMAVGDDDQAIYAFQGASVSNIQSFTELFSTIKVVVLEDNYRSNQSVLQTSLETAKFIQERPAGTEPKVLNRLSSEATDLQTELVTLTDQSAELAWLCRDIKEQLANGVQPNQIAVLAPRHRFLQDLATELNHHKVPVYYESSSNILEDEVVLDLTDLAKLVLKISSGDLAGSNSLLAEVLSAPYWGLPSGSIWRLSLFASKSEQKKQWLEHLADGALGEVGKIIHQQLFYWAEKAHSITLEQSLDLLIGVNEPQQDSAPISPFKSYYFSEEKLQQEPAKYANFLSSLSTLRDSLRDYFADLSRPRLKDLVTYIELCQLHGGIRISRRGLHIKPDGVNLITAYGSKGLEFEQVYIIHSTEEVWSESARARVDTLKFPANFSSHKDTSDDKTRLFYVAQTRAKSRLVHTLHKFDEKGKEKVLLRYLQHLSQQYQDDSVKLSNFSDQQLEAEDSAEAYQLKLFEPEELATDTDLAEVLRPVLEDYRLSATHLSTWLDEVYGGKGVFINRHLLRFPQAMSESAVHGSAVHKAMEKAHLAHQEGGELSLEELVKDYSYEVGKSALDEELKTSLIQKGEFLLEKLYQDIADLVSASVNPEVDIKVNFEEVRLSGKLDAIVIDKESQTAIVRDYKTGRPGKYIEAKYKNQLYLYKLLIDLSPNVLPKNIKLDGAELVYLNPLEDGVITLKLDYKESEYEDFKDLLKKVWSEIMNLGKA